MPTKEICDRLHLRRRSATDYNNDGDLRLTSTKEICDKLYLRRRFATEYIYDRDLRHNISKKEIYE